MWFNEKYDHTAVMTPIMVHPKTSFDNAASPHSAIRIVHASGLRKLRDAVRTYSVSLATSGGFKDAKQAEKQLQHHKLCAAEIVGLCSVAQGAK